MKMLEIAKNSQNPGERKNAISALAEDVNIVSDFLTGFRVHTAVASHMLGSRLRQLVSPFSCLN